MGTPEAHTFGVPILRKRNYTLFIIMRKILAFILLSILPLSFTFAQIDVLKQAKATLKNGDIKELQKMVDKIIVDPSTKDKAETWFVAGRVQQRKSLEQIEIITRAINTKRNDFAVRIGQLSKKVQQKLNVERKETNNLAFLQRVVRDYQYYALEEI